MFVRHKNAVHVEDVWVFNYYDASSAHLDEAFRKTFGDGKLFLCYLLPNMKRFLQLVDFALRISVHIATDIFMEE